MKCWGLRGIELINRQEPLLAGAALGKPLKPQYLMIACRQTLIINLFLNH